MQPIFLIQPFKVTTEQEQEFLTIWKKIDQYLKQQKGFISTKLHRQIDINLPVNIPAFKYINLATWESAENFKQAVTNPAFLAIAKDIFSYSGGPGLYEVVHE